MRPKTIACVVSSVLIVMVSAGAEDIQGPIAHEYTFTGEIHNQKTGEIKYFHKEKCQDRLPPCSTFKIINFLIGSECGLIPPLDDMWYEWDGVTRPITEWNQNLTVRDAFRVSCVPVFQALARTIGVVRMKEWLEALNYGTKDMSSGIDIFWLPIQGKTPLLISAHEERIFLDKLLDGNLPFSKQSISLLKECMRVKQTEKGTLFGKTGTGSATDTTIAVGWFVGFLESQGSMYTFAFHITEGKNPTGKKARSLVESYFSQEGLL